MSEDANQRRHDLREVYNGVRSIVKTSAHWRNMPHDLPSWLVVYQQTRRWLAAGCFENIIHDVRVLLRRLQERPAVPTAGILDSRSLQSTLESGARAGYDDAKRRKGSKVHVAVDALGDLLAAFVTPADEQDRAQVEQLAATVQAVTGKTVELAYVDQGYTGSAASWSMLSSMRYQLVPSLRKRLTCSPRLPVIAATATMPI